ncbi:expressed unknown protein [Seminavis robusta]|uniref:Uncharacterized protein n=1 Tax=Seminavis robusta TaxID=568900 RepID=A0A9N8HZ07_9STRA|nr:expressed unknown protein [Seminavis robusta]|eukprot:Sro2138_g316090.1 n/a (258) ;mRNA; f:7021-7794
MKPFSTGINSSCTTNGKKKKKKSHLPSMLSPRLGSLSWRPRTQEEMARKKHRRVISQHLKKIGKGAGRELSLDHNGVCCFTFKKFVVVLEVPEENSDVCLVYSKVCHVLPEENIAEVKRIIEVFNERQQRGSSNNDIPDSSSISESTDSISEAADPLQATTMLAMKDEEEVNLIFSVPIQGLSFQDTADHLERFIKTAVLANRKLHKAKILPIPMPQQEPLDESSSFRGRRPRMWSVESQTSISDLSQGGLFSLFAR